MLNPISWFARGAQMILAGALAALGAAVFRNLDALSAAGEAGWTRIALVGAPLAGLFLLCGHRGSRVPASLAVFAGLGLVVWRFDAVAAFLGV